MTKDISRTTLSGIRHNCIDPSNVSLLFGGARDSIFGCLNTAATLIALIGRDLLRTLLFLARLPTLKKHVNS
jgi:hypothetical protein